MERNISENILDPCHVLAGGHYRFNFFLYQRVAQDFLPLYWMGLAFLFCRSTQIATPPPPPPPDNQLLWCCCGCVITKEKRNIVPRRTIQWSYLPFYSVLQSDWCDHLNPRWRYVVTQNLLILRWVLQGRGGGACQSARLYFIRVYVRGLIATAGWLLRLQVDRGHGNICLILGRLRGNCGFP